MKIYNLVATISIAWQTLHFLTEKTKVIQLGVPAVGESYKTAILQKVHQFARLLYSRFPNSATEPKTRATTTKNEPQRIYTLVTTGSPSGGPRSPRCTVLRPSIPSYGTDGRMGGREFKTPIGTIPIG
uniref:Uncharacterized protein n=1 Tax=Anopheles coluzzii TaxID=1518534 RepID=A0A8W7PE64_ANOCL